jgi:hypothetical protein
MAMTLLQTVTVTASGGVTTIEFANIPGTGKDLLILSSLRDRLGDDTSFLQLNSSTANFSFRYLRGTGSAVASTGNTQSYMDSTMVTNTQTANTFSNFQIYVSNYASSANKVMSWDTVTENNATLGLQAIGGLRWNNTSAITNLKISHFTANGLAQNSTASLYIIS